MYKKLDYIKNHLEFLGYKVEKPEVAEGAQASLLAKHNTEPNFWVVEINPNVLILRASFSITKPVSPQLDEAMNTLSATTDVSNPCYVVDDGQVTVRFDAPYTGEYSKEVFADFFSYLTKDVEKMYRIKSVMEAIQ